MPLASFQNIFCNFLSELCDVQNGYKLSKEYILRKVSLFDWLQAEFNVSIFLVQQNRKVVFIYICWHFYLCFYLLCWMSGWFLQGKIHHVLCLCLIVNVHSLFYRLIKATISNYSSESIQSHTRTHLTCIVNSFLKTSIIHCLLYCCLSGTEFCEVNKVFHPNFD